MDQAFAVYTGEDIIIELANPAMLAAWGKGPEIIGKTLLDALPEIADQPFLQMLQEVWRTGVDDVGEAIPAKLVVDGRLQLFYFDYAYRAVKNPDGEVYAILQIATDVTEKVNSRQELSDKESYLRYLLSDAPTAIAVFKGPEMIVEIANKRILEIWGKKENIIGMPLHQAIPELAGQDFLPLLEQVYRSGEPYYGIEVKAMLEQNGGLKDLYVNFVYKAIKDEQGRISGIMVTATEVTEQVSSREKVQQLNEKLIAANEALNESQERLMISNLDLKSSEDRLNKILGELPVPVVVLMGPEQIIATTNEAILKLWDRKREEVLGRGMLEVFPEMKDQVYPELWKQVLESGEAVKFSEIPVTYKHRITGEDRRFYIDYFCQPLEDRAGNRIAVISTVFDVTEKVRSRKQIEEAEGRLRLAVDSAKLGTWYVDVPSMELKTSARLKEIFGFYPTDEVTLEGATNQILEEYRAPVVEAIDKAISSNETYDIEYPLKGIHDGMIRWVRATGKLYGDGKGQGNFSGIVQDITQRKNEEQRKDDFLSIASHELKTPVTSLKGSLQLLNRHKTNLGHPAIPRLISQANVSVEKITYLIDDLLNTTRSNQGQLHLNYTEFTIAELLDKCCNHIRIGGHHDLILQGDMNLKISADEMRIDQVVVNLVNNAVKYAPEQREIYLIVEDLGDRAKISVKDSGPGIPPDKVEHLFERYYRVDYTGAQYSGLGLGLYISAEIVKKHKGEIGVITDFGKGSTFWFTIPQSLK